MKKIIAFIISFCIIFSSLPMSIYAAPKSDKKGSVEIVDAPKEESDYEETLFAPVTVDKNSAVQDGEKISTIKKDGKLLVDVSEFADPDDLSDSVNTVEKDGKTYASLDELDCECELEKDAVGGKTVYSKPFQTKRLIAYGSFIPYVDEIKRETLFDGGILLSFKNEDDTENAYSKLEKAKTVSKVEGESIYGANALTQRDFPLGENLSWGADYIGSPYLVEYENKNITDREVTVAVIDTGINQKHSFLKNRVDSRSKSFVDSEESVEDLNGHGSHVAGIITDNTPDSVKIMALKALDKDGYGSDVDIANAINYATEQGANIISMSFGGYDMFTASILKTAVNNAYKAGVTLVAAAGNECADAQYFYPAKSSCCITVAATKKDGTPAGYSNFGAAVDVAAPGTNINSTVNAKSSNADIYETYSGTSMATPFVSAACADAVILDKAKSPSDLKDFVKGKVTKLSYSGDRNYGTGIIYISNYTGFEKCEPVIFDNESGYYTDELSVTMTTTTEGARIYYTTDGTIPDENSALYTEAVTINDNTQIKAVAMKKGIAKSVYTKASYRFSQYDFESNYIVDGNGYITAYLGEAENLVVQDAIAGKTVKGIGDNVFKESNLKSIVLPDTVEQLGNYAFYQCKSLKDVIAKGVKYVGERCFFWDSFTNITLGKLESVAQYAFYLCHVSEETIDIENLKTVEPYAFYECRFNEIKSNSITKVGKYAFFFNFSCVNIDLPNVKTIDSNAFEFCSSAENIRLDSVTQIGSSAFSDIDKQLKKVYCPNLKIVGSCAFDGCSKLETIDLENVIQVQSNAFGHTKLKKLNLPKLQKISAQAFAFMLSLEEVNIPKLNEIPNSLFEYCASLKKIPDAVKDATVIGSAAFRNAGITEINFPYATEVGYEAFSFTNNAKSVNLPEAIEIDAHRNVGSDELTAVTLPKVIDLKAIESSPLVEIHCPNLVKISGNGFRSDRNLKVADLPNLKTTGSTVFSGCSSLEEVNIPNVTELGYDSFRDCTSLKELYLPRCTEVSQDCFTNCESLETLDLSSLKNLDVSYSPFEKCKSLKHLILNNLENAKYVQFYKCDALKELTLPSLKSIKFEENFFDYGDEGPYRLDVNMHTPKLETMQLVDYRREKDELFHKAYVFPSTMQSIGLDVQPAHDISTLEFYYNGDIKINECVKHNKHSSPSIFENLPSEAELENGESISLRAYCADPVYTWYFSENGDDYTELPVLNSNSILPNKSGYYYCRVQEKGTELEEISNTCKVTLDKETEICKLNFNLGENINFFAGDILYQNIDFSKDIYLPEGTPIKLLYNGTFENIYVNGEKISQSPICFEFTLDGNSEVTRRDEKLIKNCVITNNLKNNTANYTSKPIVPVYSLTYKDEPLTQNVDYTIEIVNNVEPASTATVKITGIGSFEGTALASFYINPISLNLCKITIPDQEYTGEYLEPKPTVVFNGVAINGYDVEYDDNRDIGTAWCWIEGNNKTVIGYAEAYFRIGISIKNADLSFDKEYYEYTGSALTPEPIVKIGSKALTKGKDYTVTYADNTEIGTASVTVHGIGKYVFDTAAQFEISDKKPEPTPDPQPDPTPNPQPVQPSEQENIKPSEDTKTPAKAPKPKATVIKKLKKGKKKLKVTWKKVSGVSGYQLQLATDKKFKKNKKTVNVAKAKASSKTVKKLKSKKKYYVRIRTYKTVGKKTYYSSWSKAKTIKTK